MGRVLGDRSVYFKYLNPNTLAFMTSSHKKSSFALYMYVLDTVSGSVLYRAVHPGAGPLSPQQSGLHVLQVENVVVYTYWSHGLESAGAYMTELHAAPDTRKYSERQSQKTVPPVSIPHTQSTEVIVLELFEHSKPDKRNGELKSSAFSTGRPHVVAQSYTFPRTVSAIGVTRTAQGITTREILCNLYSLFFHSSFNACLTHAVPLTGE